MWEQMSQSIPGTDLNTLSVNQAFLNVSSHLSHRIWMYSLSENCVKCPFTLNREIGPHNHALMKFDVSRQIAWKFFDKDVGRYAFSNVTSFCTIIPDDVGMFGVYNIDITDDNCSYEVTLPPANVNLSLVFAFLILAIALLFIYGGNHYYKRYKQWRQSTSETSQESEGEKPKTVKPRLRSLDTFRGAAIVLMIFVNSGGGRYWWIEHATWNGLHVADLVFPWFLWIMGVCIPISIKSQIARNTSKRDIIWNVFVRSLKLFVIGLCLNTSQGTRLEEIRIMGVLQRFGIAYFVVATIHVMCLVRTVNVLPNGKLKQALYDIYVLSYQCSAQNPFRSEKIHRNRIGESH